MATYTLTDGTRKTQLTISGDATVVFPTKLDYFGVRSLDGANILVSKIKAPTVLEDGVYSTDEGDGDVVVDDGVFTDTLYLKGSGTVVVYGGAKSNHFPFKVGGKGGGGSGSGCNYKGTTTTAISNGSTTNPITIDGESYTAVFGDIVVYGYTEFVFDGTTWSEFGRPFDTVPTSGSANAVTSDGIYKRTPLVRGTGANSAVGGSSTSFASSNDSIAYGGAVQATQGYMAAFGLFNKPRNGDLFNVGNGATNAQRSNILEANHTSLNVNGDIQQNGAPLRATTMPTITASMLGKVVQYVGASDSNYKQGWNYVAVSDGAAEPTYSWQALMDSVPTSGSNNPVTSNGVYQVTPWTRGSGGGAFMGAKANTTSPSAMAIGTYARSSGAGSAAIGTLTLANQTSMTAIGMCNSPRNGDLLNIGNGTNDNHRSNIVEVNATSLNVNGDIQKNGVSLPTPYTTMPTITESMLGQIAQYVGASDSNYKQGWNYVAVSDGAAEPTYSWSPLMDSTPTSGSTNAVISDWLYRKAMSGANGGVYNTCFNWGEINTNRITPTHWYSAVFGAGLTTTKNSSVTVGSYNNPKNTDIFEVGNGTDASNRSNIVEVNSTEMNVNGDIQRDGVGIDDYTTTERKIGKWIDGSDLYQRTFEVTGLTNDGNWNQSILGTSDIDIVDWIGYLEYEDGNHTKQRYPINFKSGEYDGCCISVISDLTLMAKITPLTLIKAVITIKYTKPSVQALNANLIPSDNPFNVSVMESSETPTSNEEPTDENR